MNVRVHYQKYLRAETDIFLMAKPTYKFPITYGLGTGAIHTKSLRTLLASLTQMLV